MEQKKYVSLVGNIGRDPEVKQTGKGEVVSFSLAVSEGVGKFNADKGYVEVPTRWYRISVWDDALRDAAKTFTQGEKIAVKGTLNTREYQGKTYDEVNANTFANVGDWARKSKTTPVPAPKQPDDALPF